MLIAEKHDDVLAVKCGTEVGGKVLYWTHFYVYRNLLIDCGCPNTAREVVDLVKNLDVEIALITHYHEDHVGAINNLKEIGIKVYAPEKSISILKSPPEIPDYRKLVWGQPVAADCEPLDSKMEFGDTVVEVVETPGHTFDHVSILIDDFLFSGDLIISTNQMICLREEEFGDTITSLERILKKDFEYYFGGVGIAEREYAVKYAEYVSDLRDRVKELFDAGKSIEEIVAEVFPEPPPNVLMMEAVSQKEWSRENLVRSLLGLPR
ncbi:Zn-dependent hydrolase, including glyoxylase [Archaeoglobus sulfaticallidus PM70-1]|uniref:Zn-dependent hydrolase, including glyoxylase n=1 Tax=Archaeoglobus sulfaticallidus PM70-1 TaxID=387631 RepID=N0BDZ5_9EURY|nr:MBL fold metallo-hydrolase [Archaeoglobus sulfaticallidus]AGK61849.1 Zn-dependent hydrolase, including glyoxylase [Archaeoglobus sulfaticallidus PM70-1]